MTLCKYGVFKKNIQSHKYVKHLNIDNIIIYLISEICENVANPNDVYMPYDAFLNIFMNKHDKACEPSKTMANKWFETYLPHS